MGVYNEATGRETRVSRFKYILLLTFTLAAPLAAGIYKITVLDYRLGDILPRRQYQVTYDMTLDGHGGTARLRTFLPQSDERQTISAEANSSPGLQFTNALEGANRVAVWSGTDVKDATHVLYRFATLLRPLSYSLDPGLEVPPFYPASVAAYLRPEAEIQVDAVDLRAALVRLGADRGPLPERLRRIYDFSSGLAAKPFKGTTDALTALRLGEASCNGKSRLFVALARAAGIPARVVGGLVLNAGRKRTSHQWVEAYVAGHWVPFCPTNHHFAELPGRYLTLYRGDEVLFTHTADINFDYAFATTVTMVPSPNVLASFRVLNIWALFARLGLPFAILQTVLMLPIGALVVVIFRNVVGMPTFGTFLPALIAAAANETGALWGVVGLLVVVASVALVRFLVQRLKLLHSPTLAILLAAVTLSMLTTSLVAEKLELLRLARISLFPIAVLAISAERFYLSLAEQGFKAALKEMAGTVVVILSCYVVMSSHALQVLVIGFPEVALFVIAADVYLGRWVGVRVSEYLRFRHLLWSRSAP